MSLKQGVMIILKVIKGTDNPLEYTHEELMNSLQGLDEFTKYRTRKVIEKEKQRIIHELKKPIKVIEKENK